MTSSRKTLWFVVQVYICCHLSEEMPTTPLLWMTARVIIALLLLKPSSKSEFFYHRSALRSPNVSNTKHGWDDLNRALPRESLPVIVTDHFMIVQCLSEALMQGKYVKNFDFVRSVAAEAIWGSIVLWPMKRGLHFRSSVSYAYYGQSNASIYFLEWKKYDRILISFNCFLNIY